MVHPFRQDFRGALTRFVLERNSVVGRVYHHYVSVSGVSNHPVATHGDGTRAALGLNQRVAFVLFVFFLDFLLGHLGLFLVLFKDKQSVQHGDRDAGDNRSPDEQPHLALTVGNQIPQRDMSGRSHYLGDPGNDYVQHDAHGDGLKQGLQTVPQGLDADHFLKALDNIQVLQFGLQVFGGREHAFTLDNVHHHGDQQNGQHERQQSPHNRTQRGGQETHDFLLRGNLFQGHRRQSLMTSLLERRVHHERKQGCPGGQGNPPGQILGLLQATFLTNFFQMPRGGLFSLFAGIAHMNTPWKLTMTLSISFSTT